MEQGPSFRSSKPTFPTDDPNYRILAPQRSRFMLSAPGIFTRSCLNASGSPNKLTASINFAMTCEKSNLTGSSPVAASAIPMPSRKREPESHFYLFFSISASSAHWHTASSSNAPLLSIVRKATWNEHTAGRTPPSITLLNSRTLPDNTSFS